MTNSNIVILLMIYFVLKFSIMKANTDIFLIFYLSYFFTLNGLIYIKTKHINTTYSLFTTRIYHLIIN